jgi:hypothetical protein
MSGPYFDGPDDDPDRSERLQNQQLAIRDLMLDGIWRTLDQIAAATGAPAASASAQLRHLKKPRFGGYVLDRRHVGGGLWEYHLSVPAETPPTTSGHDLNDWTLR